MDNLHRSISKIFDDQAFAPVTTDDANWAPRVDICEAEQGYTLQIDLPGVEDKDIEITLDKNILTIAGQRSSDVLAADDSSAEPEFRRRERFTGTFARKFALPDTADGANITAKHINGVLSLHIPKTQESKPRTISLT